VNLEATYYKDIQRVLKSALFSGIKKLDDLCKSAQGAFPIDVLKAIEGLIETGTYSGEPVETRDYSYILPEPHPIDYEWRFLKDTSISIADLSEKCGNKIACFGTPTVFQELAKRNHNVKLFDRNNLLIEHFEKIFTQKMVVSDLLVDSIKQDSHNTIVMDPPWYPDHFKVWLKQALKLVKCDSYIITTIIPDLVRPNAKKEKEEILKLLEQIGVINFENVIATYETPFFERETLNIQRIPVVCNWRKCEILRVKVKTNDIHINTTPIFEPKWKRIQFGSQVVAVKVDSSTKNKKISAKPPYQDGSYILKSVSKRDKISDKINFWTSRNRCLIISGNSKVIYFLELLKIHDNYRKVYEMVTQDSEELQALKLIQSMIGL
jgi:hypothetical protein